MIEFNRKKIFIVILIISIITYIFSTIEIIETENLNNTFNNKDNGYNQVFKKLEDLNQLYKEGLIDKNDYENRKNSILDQFTQPTLPPFKAESFIKDIQVDKYGRVKNNKTGYVYPKVLAYHETLIIDGKEQVKTQFIQQKPVNITIDIMIPFPSSRVEKTLVSFDRWNNPRKLPCDQFTVGDFYPGAISNLVIYQNRDKSLKTEQRFLDKINSAPWRKCFNEIKFVYAGIPQHEDSYPSGVSKMFYNYFDYNIGPPSDYFFWLETDVEPLKKDWLIEIFRLTTTMLEARKNKPFYSLGSNARHPINKPGDTRSSQVFHINGNALYWRDKSWYDSFLVKVQNWPKRTNYFDCDIAYYFEVNENWDSVKDIYQEFIFYEFLQNLGHEDYDEIQFSIKNPRTYFVHS